MMLSALFSLLLLAQTVHAAAIQGIVKTPGGKPIAGALVVARFWLPGADPDRPAGIARSEEEGRFRIGDIAPGDYRVTATAPGFGPAWSRASLALNPNETIEADLALTAGGVTLSGAAPVGTLVRAALWILNPRDYMLFCTSANERGRFAVTLPRGRYAVSAEGFEETFLDADSDRAVELQPAPASLSSQAVTEWLRASAFAVDDFERLKTVVGDARIVALGEATHGTHEFFEIKRRLLEFLVTRLGFTVLAMETNWPEAQAVNDYVVGGKGDLAALLPGLYWTWRTQEVAEMIRWMRGYNQTHDRKVKFYGFDTQAPERATQQERGLGNARVIAQAEELRKSGGAAEALRDRFMAENVKYIREIEGPNAKLVLWAHNNHVATRAHPQWDPMGAYLRRMFGGELVVFGFAFNQGAFCATAVGTDTRVGWRENVWVAGGAIDAREFSVPPAPAGSLDATLASAGLPTFLVDLRGAPAGPVRDWLMSSHPARDVGALYRENYWTPMAPAKSYDLLVFVDKTTAAKPAL